MKTEYEVRKLEISFSEMIKKLESIGAKRVGIFYQKRYIYDFIPAQKGRWIRLRTNGIETTLAIKEVNSLSIDGTRELEVIVSDFDNTNEFLEKLGYYPRSIQKNFRIEYILDDVIFDLDQWPMIPAYMEIEGNLEEKVYSMLELLGISKNDVTSMSVSDIFKEKYGIILRNINILSFNEEEKRKIAQINDSIT